MPEKRIIKVCCCNCGFLGIDKESLSAHIRNKRKAIYAKLHYPSNHQTGGPIRWVCKLT